MPRTSLAMSAMLLTAGLAVALSAGAPSSALPDYEPYEVPNEIVVAFHGGLPADLDAWTAALGGTVVRTDDVLDWASLRFADATMAERALLRAHARGDVRFAERDAYVSLAIAPGILAPPGEVPNDPRYNEQWGYPAIFAPQAWAIEKGSHAVKVSVVDTGVRVTHPDLAANMCGPFVSTVPGSPNPDDDYGHGTHVAGTVAAVNDNNLGVAGTAQVCVMSARVLERGGVDSQWSWVAAGIVWSVDNGADVVSMSLQGPYRQLMQDAVRYAWDNNVLVVSAAANYGCPGGLLPVRGQGSVQYPGAYKESMAVAALRDPNTTADFSSCGDPVEISAAGQSVLSTVPGPGYAYFSGTSMATPHVSGVAALVKSQNPGISNVALRCLLDLTADDLLDYNGNRHMLPGRDYSTGWGRLNAWRALVTDQLLTEQDAYGDFEDACRAGADVIFQR